ncbi:hypothetical protein [Siccirubricoccus sp. G192]|uniref:hypothetical protein n=1 Tax=Siccirubricoccus sp. G192 TaxID=2849651 RepID=UPI0028111BF4|nr:hypothetical protein [Siccirubricoccus sp. G192]
MVVDVGCYLLKGLHRQTGLDVVAKIGKASRRVSQDSPATQDPRNFLNFHGSLHLN